MGSPQMWLYLYVVHIQHTCKLHINYSTRQVLNVVIYLLTFLQLTCISMWVSIPG